MESSRQWSEKMAISGQIETSPSSDAGENLYGIISVGHLDESMLNPSEAWYKGKDKYTGSYSVDSGNKNVINHLINFLPLLIPNMLVV